jgi:hypothetical protein
LVFEKGSKIKIAIYFFFSNSSSLRVVLYPWLWSISKVEFLTSNPIFSFLPGAEENPCPSLNFPKYSLCELSSLLDIFLASFTPSSPSSSELLSLSSAALFKDSSKSEISPIV